MRIKRMIQITLSIIGVVSSLMMLKKRFGSLKQEMCDFKKAKKMTPEEK